MAGVRFDINVRENVTDAIRSIVSSESKLISLSDQLKAKIQSAFRLPPGINKAFSGLQNTLSSISKESKLIQLKSLAPGSSGGDGASGSKSGGGGLGLGSLAKAGLALGGIAAVGAGISSIAKLGLDAEQTSISFGVMLGSAEKAKKVLGDLNEFANVTPFTNDEVVQAGRTFTAFGIETEKLIPTMKMVGDVASGLKIPFNELADIYGKAKVQGTLFSEDLNQLAGRGIPVFQEMAKVLGTTPDQVKKLASEGKVTFPQLEQMFKNLTSEGGRFEGMMEQQSNTAAGKLSTALGKLQTLGINLGGALAPFIGKLADLGVKILDGITPFVSQGGELLSGLFERINFDEAINGFKGFLGFIEPGINKLVPVFSNLWTTISGIFIRLQPIIFNFLRLIGQAFNSIAPFIAQVMDTVITAVDWGGILASVGDALGAVFSALIPIAQVILRVLTPVFRLLFTIEAKIINFLVPVISRVIQFIAGLFRSLAEWVNWLMDKIGEIVSAFGHILGLTGRTSQKITEKLKGGKKRKLKPKKDDFGVSDVSLDTGGDTFGGGSSPAASGLGVPTKVQSVSDGISGGGSRPVNINIQIGKLNESITVNNNGSLLDTSLIERKFNELFLRVVNGANQYGI